MGGSVNRLAHPPLAPLDPPLAILGTVTVRRGTPCPGGNSSVVCLIRQYFLRTNGTLCDDPSRPITYKDSASTKAEGGRVPQILIDEERDRYPCFCGDPCASVPREVLSQPRRPTSCYAPTQDRVHSGRSAPRVSAGDLQNCR